MNVGMRRVSRWWVGGAAALGLLLAASAPAHAATSLRTADGVLLTVEEIGGAARDRGAGRSPRALFFALQDASGARAGFVAPTVDAAADESPILALDPESGRPILIWSRHDGVAMKLAWARFEAGAWVDMHFLTFGPGDDRAPAVGTSAAGSYLFWKGGSGAVHFAPLDLGSGRLFGPPQALTIGAPGVGNRALRVRGAASDPLASQGAVDAPVIIGTNGGTDAPINIGIGTNGGTDAPINIGIGTNGGTDAPVIIEPPPLPVVTSTPGLVVFSDPSCVTQILLLGSGRGRALLAVEFVGAGRVAPLGRVVIPPETAWPEALAAAGSRLLDGSCR